MLVTGDERACLQEVMDPVFAQHRYGREDILALIRKDTKPPDGLSQCPFFTEKPLTPIILTDFNETELVSALDVFNINITCFVVQRLQQNINSSKALSAAHRGAEWPAKENNELSSSPQQPTVNPWTVAGA